MDFAEAIAFSKKFPDCHPKIFKGFDEWGVFDTETEGYVVLTKTNSSVSQLENYAKSHKLAIGCFNGYFIVRTLY